MFIPHWYASCLLSFLKTLFVFCVAGLWCGVATQGQTLRRDWVRTYANITTNKNQATAIALAPDGNIVVAGTSQNAGGDLDYEVIKYKPNGDEVWKARYGGPMQRNDQLRGITIDPAGNVIVTGTSDTVKFNSSGAFVWSVPIGGRAIIANASFVYVTGFSDADIATAQLENNNTDGQENWRRFVNGQAQAADIGQTITLDNNGNVYVGGQLDDRGCLPTVCHRGPGVASYTPQGQERWVGRTDSLWDATTVQANVVLIHPDGSVYVYGTYDPPIGITAFLAKFDSNGVYQWNYNSGFIKFGSKAIINRLGGEVLVTGRKETEGRLFPQAAIILSFTGSLSDPREIWRYLSPNGGWTEGSDLIQDSLGNLYVAGYSGNDPDSYSNAFFVAKLNSSGAQLGLDRYNPAGSVNNAATAIAIDKADNIYVAGYTAKAGGGSEFVTIKYLAAPKIEKKSNGAMHLEFMSSPGQPYAIEATRDFLSWESLMTNTADGSGLVKFDDTNAPTIPYRFYRGKQP